MAAPDELFERESQRPVTTRYMAVHRELNARSATVIFLANLAGELVIAGLITVIAVVVLAMQGGANLINTQNIIPRIRPTLFVLTQIAGGVVTVVVSMALARDQLKEVTPDGAAWVVGSWKGLANGLGIGLFLGGTAYILSSTGGTRVAYKDLAPSTQMLLTPGWQQAWSILISVILGPIAEELLFRGVLYGGYRRSFGRIWAVFLTTILFVAMHIPKVFHPVPCVAITATALATLWCRLRWNAIGAAIAVHVGCNAVPTFLDAYEIWHRMLQ